MKRERIVDAIAAATEAAVKRRPLAKPENGGLKRLRPNGEA
jgi:hypothetical protein